MASKMICLFLLAMQVEHAKADFNKDTQAVAKFMGTVPAQMPRVAGIASPINSAMSAKAGLMKTLADLEEQNQEMAAEYQHLQARIQKVDVEPSATSSFHWLAGFIASVGLAASVGVAVARKYTGQGRVVSESTTAFQVPLMPRAPQRSAPVSMQAIDRPIRVAVIGGGPSGASAAEVFAKTPNFEATLFERKMDNAKPCGGAIPLCMVDEFSLPPEIIDRKVRKMKMISPSGREVDIGQTLKPNEYIGMTRREVLDAYLRERAFESGCTPINGLVKSIELPEKEGESYTIKYSNFDVEDGKKKSVPMEAEFDIIIGADGANSRTAKMIDAGQYNFAVAYQERIRIDEDKMQYYEEMAEMYVGDDVSPDFYGWVFPKYDHVGVGTGTVLNRPEITKYQAAIRERCADRLGPDPKVMKVEAHPIPEHPRPRRVVGRVALVGDAAGYVTKCSGEGIYFAAKSGRMAAEEIVALSANGTRLPSEQEIKDTYIKKYDRAYGPTYLVLDVLQKVFYTNNGAREAFVDMCDSEYVQRCTFDSYLYKTVVSPNPVEDVKLLFNTVGSLIKGAAIAKPDRVFSNPVESLSRI
jgi:geranylgeranyl reductase